MKKRATTIEEQIAILKDRGMKFDLNKEKVRELLLDIGYYRLGFYWHPLEQKTSHNFIENAQISDVVKLYYLDVDLRNLLLKYLKRIEINFRTKLVYLVSNKYKNDAYWYANPSIMTRKYISSLSKLYSDDFKNNNKQIKKHHLKHRKDKYAPAWKTFEYLTFGTVLYTFNELKEKVVQKDIASQYGLYNLESYKNYMYSIKFIRNTCAHGGVLFDLNMPKGIRKIPGIVFNHSNNQSLDAGIKTMLFILESISTQRRMDLENKLKLLFEKHIDNEYIVSQIRTKIGYVF